jgi:hypothetical protein
VTTPAPPFIPRVLRSDAGSVAVEVGPGAPDAPGFADLYQLVVLGPDALRFLQTFNLPQSPGAMLTRDFLCSLAPDVLRWRELTGPAAVERQPSTLSGRGR